MKWFKPDQHGILILDDLMEESGNEKRVLDLYTKDSYHRAITALYLTQDLFPPGKFAKTINRNAHYVICFKSPRDKTGIRHLLADFDCKSTFLTADFFQQIFIHFQITFLSGDNKNRFA